MIFMVSLRFLGSMSDREAYPPSDRSDFKAQYGNKLGVGGQIPGTHGKHATAMSKHAAGDLIGHTVFGKLAVWSLSDIACNFVHRTWKSFVHIHDQSVNCTKGCCFGSMGNGGRSSIGGFTFLSNGEDLLQLSYVG